MSATQALAKNLAAVMVGAASEPGFSETSDFIETLPVVVLFPHNRCGCRCIMCDIWRIRQNREISVAEVEAQLESLRALAVKWVVLSGGEPQLHSELNSVVRILKEEGIRVTLLTAGLLLAAQAQWIAENIDDVIVSLDGPASVHDQIRGIPRAFERLQQGIAVLRQHRQITVAGRCTVQKLNYTQLRETVAAAKAIGLNSISFLAVDTSSEAFNRQGGVGAELRDRAELSPLEIEGLASEINALLEEFAAEVSSGYVVEHPDKLRRIVDHFRAVTGQSAHTAPRCNAPWVSAVIEADGSVRPCFFHAPLGNIHEQSVIEIVNGPRAVSFRRNLDVKTNPVCRACTCSLYLTREKLNNLR
jgi:MoaA/NifB/PqqE/SkfB family radical SAM enzyme